MFIIYQSNSLKYLIKIIAKIMKNIPLNNIFYKEYIIVQDINIQEWVYIQLANKIGISININCILYNNFIFNIFKKKNNILKYNILSKLFIKWYLLKNLNKISKNKKLYLIKEYLKDKNIKKLYQLSIILSKLFYNYQIYRSDILEKWIKNKKIKNKYINNNWQKILWKYIINKFLIKYKKKKYFNFYKNIINILKNKKNILNLPKRIFILCTSNLPPYYLKIIYLISNYIDVYFLLISPYKIIVNNNNNFNNTKILYNNKLFYNWSKDIQYTLYILSKFKKSIIFNNIQISKKKTLLKIIQKNILNKKNINNNINKKYLINIKDNSLNINICKNYIQEIEILYINILKIINNNININNNDIIIYAPNINNYYLAIKTIFRKNNLTNNLKYQILNNKNKYLNIIFRTFLKLLKLPYSRFSSEDILELLENKIIALRFNIKKKYLKIIKIIIKKTGIYWGLNNSHIKDLNLHNTKLYNWDFGITRILFGYSMDNKYGLWKNILPIDEQENKTTYIIGLLSIFLKKIKFWYQKLKKNRLLNKYMNFANDIIKDFFISNNKKTNFLLKLIKKEWKKIIINGVNCDFNKKISIDILYEEILTALSKLKYKKNNIYNNKILFCNLKNISCIPYKIIYILGMNEKKYPPIINNIEYDLIFKYPKYGDDNYNYKYKYIFLKILLSAKKKLYLSFINKSINNNILHDSSFLIKELIEYISKNFYCLKYNNNNNNYVKYNIILHICKKYNHIDFILDKYNCNSNKYIYKYSKFIKNKKKNYINFFKKIKFPIINILNIKNIINFYINPIKYLFNNRLFIFFNNNYKILTEEPFLIDNLNKYIINYQLTNAILYKENIDNLYYKFRDSGILPYGNFGIIYWNKQYKKIFNFTKKIFLYYENKNFNLKFNIKFNKIIFNGILYKIQNNGILRWNPKNLSLKDGLLLWIEHIIYCYCGGKKNSKMIGLNNSWIYKPINKNKAKKFLYIIIKGYLKGINKPLLLLNNSGGEWIKNCYNKKIKKIDLDPKIQKKSLIKLINSWNGNKFYNGDINDPYLKKIINIKNKNCINNIKLSAKKYFLFPLKYNFQKYKK